MPEITGLELQGRLRSLRPDCPVIVVTGFPTAAVRDMARKGGAAGFFAKPLGADFLTCLESLVAA
ncbi:response regulator FixJ [compost metagenome]